MGRCATGAIAGGIMPGADVGAIGAVCIGVNRPECCVEDNEMLFD